jgi:hypothetical protein
MTPVSRPCQKSSDSPFAGETACATTDAERLAVLGGAGIQPAGLLPRAVSRRDLIAFSALAPAFQRVCLAAAQADEQMIPFLDTKPMNPERPTD